MGKKSRRQRKRLIVAAAAAAAATTTTVLGIASADIGPTHVTPPHTCAVVAADQAGSKVRP